jgi:hypothetical protein
MRVVISFGYYADATAEVTAAQLDTFMAVVSKLKGCKTIYPSDSSIQLRDDTVRVNVQVLPDSMTVLAAPAVIPAPAPEA